MHELKKAKKLISEANNINILPSAKNPEGIPGALALFYSLKKLGKNVNLLLEEVPEKFHFLMPSLEAVSSPQKFLLSVQNPEAEISEVLYEKNKKSLNFYITTCKGTLKRNHLSLKIANPEPDLLIKVGTEELCVTSDIPVVEINSKKEEDNNDAKRVRAKEERLSLSGAIINFLKQSHINIDKKTATCLLAGLISSSLDSQESNLSPKDLKAAAFLKERGADHQKIARHLHQKN